MDNTKAMWYASWIVKLATAGLAAGAATKAFGDKAEKSQILAIAIGVALLVALTVVLKLQNSEKYFLKSFTLTLCEIIGIVFGLILPQHFNSGYLKWVSKTAESAQQGNYFAWLGMVAFLALAVAGIVNAEAQIRDSKTTEEGN
ncbi:hypothetical protein ABTX35_05460 [Streptomyces sp. NPDC096080]|uniref:hypothetical protein n=1 Tax=Streptomyces sp. NPDC096080 TaxID=3156693 RepID=UPI003327F571